MASVAKRRGFCHFALTKEKVTLFFRLERNRFKICNPVRPITERLVLGLSTTAPPDFISGFEWYRLRTGSRGFGFGHIATPRLNIDSKFRATQCIRSFPERG